VYNTEDVLANDDAPATAERRNIQEGETDAQPMVWALAAGIATVAVA
jgi:hypothetical protein